ncbi:MAG TPA: VanZ family protein [Rhodocyclaceae bacterium]|nr:VanZ family protein [Rhodocyclaceae bacterium]
MGPIDSVHPVSALLSARPAYRMSQYLAAAYMLLIAYASLYPFTGWIDLGIPALGFVGAAWPRYTTHFDLASNIAAYAPLGFLLVAAWRSRYGAWVAAGLALLQGCLLSFVLEWLQNYLPSRVPSNLDWGCNSLGALLGVLAGMRWYGWLNAQRLLYWRRRWLTQSHGSEWGILLVAGWLLTQLSPEILLFGSGDLRQLLDTHPIQPFMAEQFIDLETMVTASGLIAAGLMTSWLLRLNANAVVVALVLTALLLRILAYALMMGPDAATAWITPGNATGLVIGLALLLGATHLSLSWQRAVAALSLLFATVVVNLAPENPYLMHTLQTWNPGQFLNFNGLTRLVCSLWPFLALPWLMSYRAENHEIH